MLVSSFRTGEIFTQKLTLLPKNPQLTNYVGWSPALRVVSKQPDLVGLRGYQRVHLQPGRVRLCQV